MFQIILLILVGITSLNALALDCQFELKSKICVVENGKNLNCLPNDTDYAETIINIYDHMPAVMQKMMCKISKVYIAVNFGGTASITEDFAGDIQIIIRKSILDNKLSLSQWASWKEQLSYGNESDNFEILADYPRIAATANAKINTLLYYIITHEFGHILDWKLRLNNYESCPDGTIWCAAKGSWTSLSWQGLHKIQEGNDFYRRNEFCFYFCNNHYIDKNDIPRIYRELYETNLITPYAGMNEDEDIADSIAIFLFHKYLMGEYYVVLPDGKQYDLMAKIHSPIWADKYTYLENLFETESVD